MLYFSYQKVCICMCEREKVVFLLPPCVPDSTGLPSGHGPDWLTCATGGVSTRWFMQRGDYNNRHQTKKLLQSCKSKSWGSRTSGVIEWAWMSNSGIGAPVPYTHSLSLPARAIDEMETSSESHMRTRTDVFHSSGEQCEMLYFVARKK